MIKAETLQKKLMNPSILKNVYTIPPNPGLYGVNKRYQFCTWYHFDGARIGRLDLQDPELATNPMDGLISE